jgi:DNA replicative helicase MCM subunit Mcm2 (Cdc46/Mcm family)
LHADRPLTEQVRLQETPEDNLSEFYGRVPRTVEVELLDDLVDKCRPGDSAVIIGLVKSVEVAAEGGGGWGRGASAKPKYVVILPLIPSLTSFPSFP